MVEPPLRVQRLHHLLKRNRLVSVAAQRRFPRPPQQLNPAGAAPKSNRSASVLTKNPMRPSSSDRVRFAIGVPTTTSR